MRFAAYVHDRYAYGFNYLLVREDENDLYGESLACIGTYTFRGRHLYKPEKFGFALEKIREIERSEQAIHTFKIEFEEDVVDYFLRFTLEAMKRSAQ